MANPDEKLIEEFGRLPASQVHRSFSYDRQLLPNSFLAEQEENVDSLPEAVHRSGLSMGYPAWNLLYFTMLCSLKNHFDPVIVETGTNLGFSTIVMAQVLKDAGTKSFVRTVDIDPLAIAKARENAKQAGVEDLIRFSINDSRNFLNRLRHEVDRIDFAFLDGGHEAGLVIEEFESIHPLILATGGTVFFDNTSSGGVAEALRTIKSTHGGNLIEFSNCSWAPPGNAIWQP